MYRATALCPKAALGRETGFHFFIGAHPHPPLEMLGVTWVPGALSFSSPSSSDVLTPLAEGVGIFAVPSLGPSRRRGTF